MDSAMMDAAMDVAILLARVFGPFLGILGLWMLLYSDNVHKIMTSVKGSPAAVYAAAGLDLVLGLFIINLYNFWSWNAFIFVTLLGWVFFIKGVLGLFAPQLILEMRTRKASHTKAYALIPFIWGLILIWAGYYI